MIPSPAELHRDYDRALMDWIRAPHDRAAAWLANLRRIRMRDAWARYKAVLNGEE